jgi:CubicO group peptidase (beta-lactamase class C family)
MSPWAWLTVGVALVLGSCASDRSGVLQRLLDASIRRNGGRGGGVVRVESDARGVVWQGASGHRVDGEPMAVSDTFEVASVTKTFTATCVLFLVEDGKLRLDQPMGDLLPPKMTKRLLVIGGHDYSPEITIEQLLAHKSGLPDYWTDPPLAEDGDNAFVHEFLADPDRLWEPQEILPFVRKLTPIGSPGQRFHYCDTGYVLLGLVVERVTGMKLHEVMRQRIVDPLSMTDTYFSYYEPPPPGERESHRFEGSLDLFGQRRQSAEWGAGGLVSSTRDLSRFIRALAEGKLFKSPDTLKAMTAWTPTGEKDVEYGLGLFRIALDGGRGQLWGHDGHGNAFMYYWPEQGMALVGTLNQTENDWWDFASPAVRALSTTAHGGGPR